ncbi:uncharacterized protein [Danio rerio]|uniref:Uncharacterized protein n=1 Tax=Danio rerio TaxID=7955 RepID=A0AC58J045_DANRE
MADRSPLFLLLIFWTLSTGVIGAKDIHVFSSSGETARLRCINVDLQCKRLTWTYQTGTTTFTLTKLGVNVESTEKHERLNLSSDCSLIISRVTTEDAGYYMCLDEAPKYEDVPHVYLHVLDVSVSSSSSSSDIRPGPSLTLSCQLFSYSGFRCEYLVTNKDLHLSWLDEAGVKLHRDSRYQISSTGCIISLSTTLISEDEDKQWRCGVYQGNDLMTSATVQHSGLIGAGDTHVFSSSGETVHLPCRNTDQQCRPAGTTWMYTFRQTYSQTTKIIVLGVKEMATKVSMYLGSDCSLTLSRVMVEMAGRYTCQQWSEDQQYGPDAHVYLHVVAGNFLLMCSV